jgi:hypothetical protein
VLALEPYWGHRVVARPESIDAMMLRAFQLFDQNGKRLGPDRSMNKGDVLRIAPDEALIIGGFVEVIADEHAIIEHERGLSGCVMSHEEFDAILRPVIEWQIPEHRPCLCQGLVQGVPVKLLLRADDVLMIVVVQHAHELRERLG